MRENGGIVEDVASRIICVWIIWEEAAGVLCDKKVPSLKVKWEFYRIVVRPAMDVWK